MDEKEILLKQQQNHANIVAARTFLKMSEQRDSVGSLGGASGRSSLGPDMNKEYVNIYRSEKASVIGKVNKGLTEQVIKKNTLDKGRSRPQYMPDPSNTEQNIDAESQRPEQASVISNINKKENVAGQSEKWQDGSEYSREYSQNVEVCSNRTSEFKYLFGEKLELAEETKDPRTQDPVKDLELKQKAVENRFIKLYNRQGYFSAGQSVKTVYGACVCQFVRLIQCIFCCQCAGFFRIKDSVDFKRFLINFTKLLSLVLIAITFMFFLFSLNELGALETQGGGMFMLKQYQYPAFPA